MRWSALLVLAFLTCGCLARSTSPSASPGQDTNTNVGAVRSVCVDDKIRPVENKTCSRRPGLEQTHLGFAWTGKLGVVVGVCPAPIQCVSQVVGAESEKTTPLSLGNLTDLHARLTWPATTPATQTLTLGVMVMGCPGCPPPYAKEVSGPSPLSVDLTDARLPVNESHVLHVYVYNPGGLLPAPINGYASPDQGFKVVGNATIEVRVRH